MRRNQASIFSGLTTNHPYALLGYTQVFVNVPIFSANHINKATRENPKTRFIE